MDNRDVFGVLKMRELKNTRKLVLTIVFVILTIFCCFTVSADPETDETYAVESFVPETEAPTEEETTEEFTEEEPTEETTAVEEESSVPFTEEEPEPTYRESLPEAPQEDIVIPEAIGEIKEENEPSLFWGFVAWICIGVGVAVVLAVLLTTKTKAYRGGGSMRYSTGDKISGKKRLLNDKYYHSNKRK